MRRIAAVLVLLLTATAARANLDDLGGINQTFLFGVTCCGTFPIVLLVTVTVSLAICERREARRKAARRRELMNGTSGEDE